VYAGATPDFLVQIFAELGATDPASMIRTVLLKDRFFVGWKFRYDGGHVILRAASDAIEFYDEDGTLLKTVTLEVGKGAAA
jgi:hypothetical protein